jgi:hypothetical protein
MEVFHGLSQSLLYPCMKKCQILGYGNPCHMLSVLLLGNYFVVLECVVSNMEKWLTVYVEW